MSLFNIFRKVKREDCKDKKIVKRTIKNPQKDQFGDGEIKPGVNKNG